MYLFRLGAVGGSGAPRNAPVLTQGFSSSPFSHPVRRLGRPSPCRRFSRSPGAEAVGTKLRLRAPPPSPPPPSPPPGPSQQCWPRRGCSSGRGRGPAPLPRLAGGLALLFLARVPTATSRRLRAAGAGPGPGPDWCAEGVSGFIYATFSSRLYFIGVDGRGSRRPSPVGRTTNGAPARTAFMPPRMGRFHGRPDPERPPSKGA